MEDNILLLVKRALGGDFPRLAGQLLGESESGMQTALGAMLPAVVGGIAQRGASPAGAVYLLSLLDGPNVNAGLLNDMCALFSDNGARASATMKAGTHLVAELFGDKSAVFVNSLTSVSQLKTASVANLLALAVPVVMCVLKRLISDNRLETRGVASVLGRQDPHLQRARDPRITDHLGSPAQRPLPQVRTDL